MKSAVQMIFSWFQTSTNVLQLPTKPLASTIWLITTNDISSKIVKMTTAQIYKGTTLQENCKKYNRSLHYGVLFSANCLHIL